MDRVRKNLSLLLTKQPKISEKLNQEQKDNELQTIFEASIETEKKYYKEIFDNLYPNCSHILPYFWMPKYTNSTDPSARTLDIYEKNV